MELCLILSIADELPFILDLKILSKIEYMFQKGNTPGYTVYLLHVAHWTIFVLKNSSIVILTIMVEISLA